MDRMTRCYGCGALVKDIPGKPHEYIGASAGCWEVFGEVLAREYDEFGYPAQVHRLTVDTYAVQHPGEPNRRAIQSVHVHLVSLYLIIEHHASGLEATRSLGKILKHAERFRWLEPPTPNGHMTVLDIAAARNFDEHQRLVQRWAKDVWQAWAPHHPYIRELVRRYLG